MVFFANSLLQSTFYSRMAVVGSRVNCKETKCFVLIIFRCLLFRNDSKNTGYEDVFAPDHHIGTVAVALQTLTSVRDCN